MEIVVHLPVYVQVGKVGTDTEIIKDETNMEIK